ncbi:zf-TFIIB domain-containing protein [Mycetocola sp.]|uniref:TFIIB-type zinc ribbon-containing protein n=1 Tax=Mycetocola sp. TaxID=1871042 RepID=UPI00398963AB
MKCPTDSATLVMSERGGVEIDYCPECRGVWLDRGELDKIIERAENEMAKNAPAPAAAAPIIVPVQQQRPPYDGRNNNDSNDRNWNDHDRDRRYDNRDGYRKNKKESWIADLFG